MRINLTDKNRIINKNEEFDNITDNTMKDTINGMMIKEYEYWKCIECGKLMQEKNNLKIILCEPHTHW